MSTRVVDAERTEAADAPPTANVTRFANKWKRGGSSDALSERAGAQVHFLELCDILKVVKPDDPQNYCFERALRKNGDEEGSGFADVWKRGYFAWEYKRPNGDLNKALQQLMPYAFALDNPPLLVVSDRRYIEVHTHFTGHPSSKRVYDLADIADAHVQYELRQVFVNPDYFRPGERNREITERAASVFASTAERLRARGIEPTAAAHFLSQCVFCFFAEDVGLLPKKLFKTLLSKASDSLKLQSRLTKLFEAMRTGGDFGAENIEWFNGGLFNSIDVPVLERDDLEVLENAASLDWAAIDPSIFGTLFERGLNPSKRTLLGAHYTDPRTIQRIVTPLIERPLLAEWATYKEQIGSLLSKRDYLNTRAKGIPSKSKPLRDRHSRLKSQARALEQQARDVHSRFVERIGAFRLLDPACGSGNFLYLGLKALKDVEHQVNIDAEQLGLERQIPVTGPHNVLGLEVDEYAAELARVTIWIGEIQWRILHNLGWKTDPILEALEQISRTDALLKDGTVVTWPRADVVLGNPPFLGNKRMRSELGVEYTECLRKAYEGGVPGEADLVCYWFEKARQGIRDGKHQRAGLVATNSIRSGANRVVLRQICETSQIFEAWSDEPWVNEGAAVRVSLICFGASDQEYLLDGRACDKINANITTQLDLTLARPLAENRDAAFQGSSKVGDFEVPEHVALRWLEEANPHGKPNSDVLRPWVNGNDLTRRTSNTWIVDFGTSMPESLACMYEAPYRHVQKYVKPARAKNNREAYRRYWWRHAEARVGLRKAIENLPRYIVTPRVAKFRNFVWVKAPTLPDTAVVCIPRSDDVTFGVLHSRFHQLWALMQGSSLEDRPRYTPTSCFETYPFPKGMSPADTSSRRTRKLAGGALVPGGISESRRKAAEDIARSAKNLNDLREMWLNPPEWTQRVPSPGPEYPDRVTARSGFDAKLAERTLTTLYNVSPKWLQDAQSTLDHMVAAAYGWPDYTDDMTDDDLLGRLLALNRLAVGHGTLL